MKNIKNKVQLIGNLGIDPEIKELSNGRKMAKFSLATSDYYTDSTGNKIKETHWHNIVAWGNVAMITEKYLKKGNEVAVQGKLTHRSYEDKEGVKKYRTEIVANELMLMSKKNQTSK